MSKEKSSRISGKASSLKSADEPFWKTKRMSEMTPEEWESLCDRCGKCCLMKAGVFCIRFTKMPCPLLDIKTAQCRHYENRHDFVPDCIKLTPQNLKSCRKWLPKTCSYLWLLKKKTLPPWHPFVSGKKNSVHTMGISVKNRAVPYQENVSLKDFIVKWDDL